MADTKTPKAPEAGTTGDMRTDPLLQAENDRPSIADTTKAALETAERDREERLKPAKIGAESADAFEASGAVIEADALKEIDVDHPAVDNNPRAGTTVRQNKIDFNDPTLNDRQAVEERLEAQGSK
jgi:hypothetical protein